MKMATVTAIKKFPYGRKIIHPGICQIEKGHVLLFKTLGLITVPDIPVVKKPLSDYIKANPPELEIETEMPPGPEIERRKKHHYRRRDMRAED